MKFEIVVRMGPMEKEISEQRLRNDQVRLEITWRESHSRQRHSAHAKALRY